MGRKIIKKIGGDRLGSGKKMTVAAHGYGFSTHDVSKVRRTSMTFGTLIPMYTRIMPSGSRLRINLDALITSNALLYQLYGSCKFQLDVFSARMALYNPKMLLNLNDQGYNISDIKFPQMEVIGKPITWNEEGNRLNEQINPSALLRYLGINYIGNNDSSPTQWVVRDMNAMTLLMYYQVVKEYYANKQEKVGYMIHAVKATPETINNMEALPQELVIEKSPLTSAVDILENQILQINFTGEKPDIDQVIISMLGGGAPTVRQLFNKITDFGTYLQCEEPSIGYIGERMINWNYEITPPSELPFLVEYDLKAIDRMMMKIMANVDSDGALRITGADELPYSASFKRNATATDFSINAAMEGICVGTYQSDVFNNWLDNATINNLSGRSKVKIDENGEFSIDLLNITQKMYNYDMRIGITDGTLDEWRELTYGQKSASKSLKPVYEGGLSKEILFDMVISTAASEDEPLGSIASRGSFGNKHKGGQAIIDANEEKIVMVIGKITPRIVYNQGVDWVANLKTLEDLHKPAFDKIGYQNLITDTMAGFETRIKADGSLITYSAGKQPAWQWYRTDFDDALGNMAYSEDYKVFGRNYEAEGTTGNWRIKDLTTYIDPRKFNDVFAIQSLDAMNFDVQVGIDATLTMVMSEEVIPGL